MPAGDRLPAGPVARRFRFPKGVLMYAIVQVGGRQYRAAPGDRLVVDRLDVEAGSRVHLADVRMLVAEDGDGGETQIGRPRLEGVAVAARAVSHFRGPKILVFKYKPKKRYRRHQGFRAELTELRVEEVRLGQYHDQPAEEPARKSSAPGQRKPARAKAVSKEAVTRAPAAAKDPAPAKAVKRTPAKSRAGAAPAAKEPAIGAETIDASAAKPRAARSSAKAVSSSPAGPTGKPAPRTRAKPKPSQEQPDGS